MMYILVGNKENDYFLYDSIYKPYLDQQLKVKTLVP